jgi:hypothetical protein
MTLPARDGRRILGPDRSLTSDQKFFVTSVPLMQWAMDMGCRTEGLCTSAALSGSMDVLKWLREENDPPCPWNIETCIKDASGHLREWLLQQQLWAMKINYAIIIIIIIQVVPLFLKERQENGCFCISTPRSSRNRNNYNNNNKKNNNSYCLLKTVQVYKYKCVDIKMLLLLLFLY